MSSKIFNGIQVRVAPDVTLVLSHGMIVLYGLVQKRWNYSALAFDMYMCQWYPQNNHEFVARVPVLWMADAFCPIRLIGHMASHNLMLNP